MEAPALVVITYNRPSSLRRLLRSLAVADVPPGTHLVISIDGGGDDECCAAADDFEWLHGPKEVIRHRRNLGLREHVLSCGDLSASMGAVVLLEDDIIVSPAFYRFLDAALRHYQEDPSIAGISLYSQRYNETAGCVFEPLANGYSTYLAQMPSSWGEAFTAAQWRAFREWLIVHTESIEATEVPLDVQQWPPSSWKRLMCAYSAATARWFVYPYVSYSTNFGEVGVHTKYMHHALQAELALDHLTSRFPSIENAVKYDLWWELVEDGVEWDVYGSKPRITGRQVISPRRLPGYRQTRGFGVELRPIQMNFYLDNRGDDFWLNERANGADSVDADLSPYVANRLSSTRSDWIRTRRLLDIIVWRLRNRIRKQ